MIEGLSQHFCDFQFTEDMLLSIKVAHSHQFFQKKKKKKQLHQLICEFNNYEL